MIAEKEQQQTCHKHRSKKEKQDIMPWLRQNPTNACDIDATMLPYIPFIFHCSSVGVAVAVDANADTKTHIFFFSIA